MTIPVIAILCSLLVAVPLNYSFKANSRPASSTKLNLFGNWGKKNDLSLNPTTSTTTGKPADEERLKLMRQKLEKVSNKQNRDYNAEAKANAPAAPVIRDKQTPSRPEEFPNLYKGWIFKEGDQIAKQIVKSTNAALKAKEKYIEVLFDPVPNLDEVAFGTEWNKKLRKEVVANLKVPEFAANKGGPAILEWSNIYWANRLGEGIKSAVKKPIIVLSISGEGLKGKDLPTMGKGITLVSLTLAKKPGYLESVTGGAGVGAFILNSPCSESHYKDGVKLADEFGATVIALNSPYSYRYDVGGGKPYMLTYVMKRIPKGWIFRNYPSDFQGIIEGTNYEVFKSKDFGQKQPSLPEISKVNMEVSADKYGKAGNDRIFQNRL
jgi:hypothetical protein